MRFDSPVSLLQYGDTFTLLLAGQRMTFLYAPTSVLYFFKAPASDLPFTPAVEQFTRRVFQLPPAHFVSKHHLLLTRLRHQVGVAETLPGHAARLLPLLMDRMGRAWRHELHDMAHDGQHRMELMRGVENFLFPAAVDALFGARFLRHHGSQRMQEAFFAFEGCFELAASPVPHAFQPHFRAARRTLLRALTHSYKKGDFKGSTVDALIQGCGLPDACVPNMLLAVLWASQANTTPAVFWGVAFLLLEENAHHLRAIQRAVLQGDDAANDESDGPESGKERANGDGSGNAKEGTSPPPHLRRLSPAQLNRLKATACDPSSLLVRCCLEAVRLRSPSIDVRLTASHITLPSSPSGNERPSTPGFTLPQGSVVAISPWAVHLDPRYYTNPDLYDPDRKGMALPGAEGGALHAAVAGVGGLAGVSFGGGQYRCPGRAFAEMEMALAVGLILCSYDLRLDVPAEGGSGGGGGAPGDARGALPPPDLQRLVGIKVPKGPCWCALMADGMA